MCVCVCNKAGRVCVRRDEIRLAVCVCVCEIRLAMNG